METVQSAINKAICSLLHSGDAAQLDYENNGVRMFDSVESTLDDVLKKCVLLSLDNPRQIANDGSNQQQLQRIRLEHQELQTKTTNLQKALDSFIEAADMVDQPPSEEQMDRIQQNIDVAQEILLKGLNRLVQLSLFLEQNSNTTQSDAITDEALQPRLAPLPIPKFRGQLWEWDHFWSIFEAVIHKSNISRIEKLSYLLEALQGPAMDTVKELQVTADNYDVAIQLLRRKYDNQEAVISQLLQHLQDMRPRSATIADQMHTLDKILPVLAQLEQKGENTNTQQMRRTTLSKFNDRIQRWLVDGAFEQKHQDIPVLPLQRYQPHTEILPKVHHNRAATGTAIKRRNLCHNCGSPDHRAKGLYRWSMPTVQRKGSSHLNLSESSQTTSMDTETSKECSSKGSTRGTSTKEESSVSKLRRGRSQPELYILQDRRPRRPMPDVHIMMDTGADQSFITRNYADHLGLGKTGQLQLTIHTFGNSSPTEQSCETTQVEIEDRQGVRHSFELAKIDFITGDVKRTELHREDRQYLQDHDIQLSISPQIQTLQTPILLGCGDLFTLFDQGLGQKHSLPSG
ncbi:hypothetical protein OSTOST_20185 [Ostertagia ostertagi]